MAAPALNLDNLASSFFYRSVFGQIKSVRLPKKLTGSSSYRGFGFVDFVLKEDAKVSLLFFSKFVFLNFVKIFF